MMCTGLKKCMPITRLGLGIGAAMSAIESELVLVPSTASFADNSQRRARRCPA